MATPKKPSKPKTPTKASEKSSSPKASGNAASAAVNFEQHGASAAMAILAARGKQAPATAALQGESAAFKKLKASAGGSQFSAGSPLANVNQTTKTQKPVGPQKMQGYASTKTSAAPTGVPRRTSGG